MSKILIVNKYYSPAYKAGGPIQSLKNMASVLKEENEVYVYTGDRDFGDNDQFPSIITGTWNNKNGLFIYYSRDKKFSIIEIKKLLMNNRFDFIYLNSYFDLLSLKMILCHKYLKLKSKILLAPRGELYSGALQIKNTKKRIYMALLKILKLTDNITFHYTSEDEFLESSKYLDNEKIIVPNIPTNITSYTKKNKTSFVKIIYLSRITPKKNIKIFLEMLNNHASSIKKEIILDIYGIADDASYWSECESLIQRVNLQRHIQVKYCGIIEHDKVSSKISEYDLFVLPTLGENFGHAIFESLASSTPILLSKNTPWVNLQERKAGYNFDLNIDDIFAKFNLFLNLTESEYNNFRSGAFSCAKAYLLESGCINSTKEMFRI